MNQQDSKYPDWLLLNVAGGPGHDFRSGFAGLVNEQYHELKAFPGVRFADLQGEGQGWGFMILPQPGYPRERLKAELEERTFAWIGTRIKTVRVSELRLYPVEAFGGEENIPFISAIGDAHTKAHLALGKGKSAFPTGAENWNLAAATTATILELTLPDLHERRSLVSYGIHVLSELTKVNENDSDFIESVEALRPHVSRFLPIYENLQFHSVRAAKILGKGPLINSIEAFRADYRAAYTGLLPGGLNTKHRDRDLILYKKIIHQAWLRLNFENRMEQLGLGLLLSSV